MSKAHAQPITERELMERIQFSISSENIDFYYRVKATIENGGFAPEPITLGKRALRTWIVGSPSTVPIGSDDLTQVLDKAVSMGFAPEVLWRRHTDTWTAILRTATGRVAYEDSNPLPGTITIRLARHLYLHEHPGKEIQFA